MPVSALAPAVTGHVALGMNLVDTLTHGWDIAIATGQNSELPPDAAAAALTSARVIVTEQFRAFAGFAPAAQTDEGASPTDQLIAFVGRKPRSATNCRSDCDSVDRHSAFGLVSGVLRSAGVLNLRTSGITEHCTWAVVRCQATQSQAREPTK